MLGLNFPAAQATHSCGGPVLPASHMHATTSLLRATECVWSGQEMHRELSADEYFPPAQLAHAFVAEALCARNSPGSHCSHAVFSLVLYLPAGQPVHSYPDCTT